MASDERKQTWFSIGGSDISLGSIKAALGLVKLHVITAEQKAVLDACASCQLRYLKLHAKDGMGSAWVSCVAEAELARREALRGK